MLSYSSIVSTVRSACAPYRSRVSWKRAGVAILLILLIGGYYIAFAPPADFSPGSIVRVSRGTS
ncbi:MAG TPA: hypothetical protein VMV62_01850, partial [Candidatus Paceibacterota bacterium]|nr:hypothetical protein [Candidatus Paceibacterota bacterium]